MELSLAGWIGIVLAGAGLLLIAVELVVIVPRARRLRQGLVKLQATRSSQLRGIQAELVRWRLLARQRERLSSPHRRAWRYYRHPLTEALLVSYRRRRQRLP